ncbi:DUF928 domain-containing protein [Nostoc sp. 'Peltigera membranacea cyanobiont' 232]|uniref:DUF928 domain-containing protein n=1 Tax=Nostoc sp. 'Peltigera membranacea cyanobiont' 232 TaxID=2014531 RepID=UPI000B958B67|nr:DUF928 domain-containing protein [Nostoc sp. 'Peltigera membranacea cyanobiont' 232]OYE01556.1 hypothetical protein CDG79_28920 [Nostoc sp. 'Peltigera membranacea cyanobiont' 232]
MKLRYLASTLSIIALFASSTWNSANAVTFTPPINNGAPSQATGGASRGNFFIPTSGKGAPSQATGGASRGSLFTPSAGKGAPRQATGGASRGSLFTPSAGKGTPQQASGGASRVGTYYLNTSTESAGPAALIALLPQSFYGTTVSEHPTILVYLPVSNAEEAVFSLKDETGNTQYQMTIPITLKAGAIAIKLPADAPALVVGKNYHWFLAVKVDGQLSPSTPYVDGWIQRIQPSAELATAMQQQDALKRATAFGKNGVWYDCVETLAALHSAQPTNVTLTKQWEELLSSVNLKEIVTAPLLGSTN